MQPSITTYVTEHELRKRLLSTPAIENFSSTHLDEDSCWVKSLIESPTDVAFIQANNFTADQHEILISSNILKDCDVIFFSDGKPNPAIDRAMLQGVSYHFKKPFDLDYIDELLAEMYTDISQQNQTSDEVITSKLDQFGLLAGSSNPIRRLYRIMRKAAESETTVFLVGESGTGKELVANTIHMGSPRANHPFVAINCGALSPELIESELFGHVKGAFTGAGKDREGVFETADGGTLFLDEITEMPLDHQVKLLRVLETGEYRSLGSDELKNTNVRIIAATNREPAEAIRVNSLREDLYFRLCQFPICIPPLRERDGDIVGLAKHFLAYRNVEENTAIELGNDALEKIRHHSWPGNVRELKHAIERAYILADNVITAEHLIIDDDICEPEATCGLPTDMPLDELEKKVIIKSLEQHDGNKSETAETLGISVKTLYNKLEKYNRSDDPEKAKSTADG